MVAAMDEEILGTIRSLLESIELLPETYATYQPMLIDALLFFFAQLTPEHMGGIIAAQAALDPAADADTRLVALLQQCPTLHKLGQVVSHEPGLAAALRERLQSLETLPPAADPSEIAALLRAEIGEPAGVTIAPEALAEGSVAVVVPFEWTDPAGTARRGVFKFLKPVAVARMHEELAIWTGLSSYLEERTRFYGLPMLDYRGLIEGVARLLLHEIELDREQANLTWAAGFYADSKDVVIPKLLPFSTPRVTAMERIEGTKVTDPSVADPVRKKLAKTLVKALIADPFWKASDLPARFHADPHAGNLFVTPDGKLAILDWALTTELDESQLSAVVRSLLGALTFDEVATYASVEQLGRVDDAAGVRAEIAAGIARVRRGTFPGFVWLVDLLDRLGRSGSMTFPEATTLFRKSLLTLTGVVADVCREGSVDDVLVRSGAAEFGRELRRRPGATLDSRAFGTHVSNADLIKLWASVPWMPTRYVLDTWLELLAPAAAAAKASR
jgi:ubiquinone biosynthesis protein